MPPVRAIESTVETVGVVDSFTHPLYDLLLSYYKDYHTYRELNEDLENNQFHIEHGLTIKVPSRWPLRGAIKHVVNSLGTEKLLVIYSTSNVYRDMQKAIGDRAEYISWHEIFSAMRLTSSDATLMRRVRTKLSEASLTFFVDAPTSIMDVLDQVRGFSNGCLIVIERYP